MTGFAYNVAPFLVLLAFCGLLAWAVTRYGWHA